MIFLPYKETEAIKSTKTPAPMPTPYPSCDPAQGQGLHLALEASPLPSLAHSMSLSPQFLLQGHWETDLVSLQTKLK